MMVNGGKVKNAITWSDAYDMNCKSYRELVGKDITKFSFHGPQRIYKYHNFIDKLTEYFSSIEEYEKCAFLVKLKKIDG